MDIYHYEEDDKIMLIQQNYKIKKLSDLALLYLVNILEFKKMTLLKTIFLSNLEIKYLKSENYFELTFEQLKKDKIITRSIKFSDIKICKD